MPPEPADIMWRTRRTLQIVLALSVITFVIALALEVQISRRNAVLDRVDQAVTRLEAAVADVDEDANIIRAVAEGVGQGTLDPAIAEGLRQIAEIYEVLVGSSP